MFYWDSTIGNAVHEKNNDAPQARTQKRLLLYLCPSGESFGAVFGNGAGFGRIFQPGRIGMNLIYVGWGLSGRGPF